VVEGSSRTVRAAKLIMGALSMDLAKVLTGIKERKLSVFLGAAATVALPLVVSHDFAWLLRSGITELHLAKACATLLLISSALAYWLIVIRERYVWDAHHQLYRSRREDLLCCARCRTDGKHSPLRLEVAYYRCYACGQAYEDPNYVAPPPPSIKEQKRRLYG
jgi:hypothetical protein